MATKTLGTAGAATLVAVQYSGDPGVLLPADLATVNYAILDDQATAHPVAAISGIGGFVREGFLYVPNRGSLRLLPNDWVAYDAATGWPILVSSRAGAAAGWVHS